MNAIELKKMMDLPQPERIRTFERWLKHIGLTRSQIAQAIHAIKEEVKNDK